MTRQQIIQKASEAHAQYPQYDGYWDGDEWYLVVFTKRVRTKFGIVFEKGDVTLARGPQYRDQHDDYPTAYSLRSHMNTSVRWTDFQRVNPA